MPRKNKNKKVVFILSVIICLLIIITFLFLIEGIFRLVGVCEAPQSETLGNFLRKADNPNLVFELKENSKGFLEGKYVEINSQGLRDYNYDIEKPENTYRIATVGDSVTFGFGVGLDESYVKILEKKLNENSNKNFEAINFGVPGYVSSQELIVLKEKVLKYEPDLIIIGHFLNDPENTWNPFEDPPSVSKIKLFLNKHSCFYHWARKRKNEILIKLGFIKPYKELYNENSDSWLKHKKTYEEILEISKEHDISILVILLPNWVNLNENYDFKDIHKLLNKTFIGYGLNVVDIFPEVKGLNGEEYRIDEKDYAHPNYKGHEIIAETIYENLKQNNFYSNV